MEYQEENPHRLRENIQLTESPRRAVGLTPEASVKPLFHQANGVSHYQ